MSTEINIKLFTRTSCVMYIQQQERRMDTKINITFIIKGSELCIFRGGRVAIGHVWQDSGLVQS